MSVSKINNAEKHIYISRKNRDIDFGICNIRQSEMKYYILFYWDMITFYFNITHGGSFMQDPRSSRHASRPWSVKHQ